MKVQKAFNDTSKKDFFGESYNVFVGKHNYPNIDVGILNIDEPIKDEKIDNPLLWSKNNYDINQIIQLRSSLINSNFKSQVKGFKDKFSEITQEISLAEKPVDVEVSLEKKPKFSITFNQDVSPFGPSVKLEKARITENTKIPDKVEKLVNDDVSSVESLNILHSKGFDEHYLTKILSMGNLGYSANKKLVPTRWSITAVDDTLGKESIKEIKNYKYADYQIFYGSYLGNHYLILFFPEPWSYELFETLVSEKATGHDNENYYGRKEYAHETAGGYYAARYSILQKLKEIKKQASVLALRFVTDDYWAPLGVWVVREAVKKAMVSKPISFQTKQEMLKYALDFIKKNFDFDVNTVYKTSSILKELKQQKKINEY